MSEKKLSTTSGDDGTAKREAGVLTVVGIGASAGGLEALQAMVSNLPSDTNISFIVAQHLSPSYKSMMVDLLEKDSTIPIFAAEDGTVLQPNTIYICPPNYNIELSPGDVIRLTSYPEIRHTPRPSVDMLFESIATVKGEHSIGVILSGTGSDGARGIRAIKGENGLGIVQDPNTAKYNGMPNAAINSGNVDLILPASEIGEELKNVLMFPIARSREDESTVSRDIYNSIIRQLKIHCNVDFGLYKENTIIRRIERRMASLKIAKAADYLKHLNLHTDEVSFLFNDMLIGVTSFFRDARAFDILKNELAQYIERKEDKIIRVWCTGCSTGEEPYSVAMVISDILGSRINDYKIQIFATDIDSRAINYARNAVYPEAALQNLPKAVRKKFFVVNGDQYEVIKPIKAMVIFSIHDVNSDPPFLRLDLITCRNLMIYFTLELQRQVLPIFHYALNPKGLLMLGQSESIGVFQEQYRQLSKSGKIYESVYIGKKLPPERSLKRRTIVDYVETPSAPPISHSKRLNLNLDEKLSELITQRIREFVFPNAILINENLDIIYTQGSNPLLVRPEGLPTNNIYKNLNPLLTVDLRSALHSIDRGEEMVSTGYQNLVVGGETHWVKLTVVNIVREAPLGALVLIFCHIEKDNNLPIRADSTDDGSGKMIALEQQRLLNKTKEQLQDVIEELETSNEEMQSMNEELQSSNEELQSSNEELETTNEELQSTNEELQTAYAELRMAYEEKDQQRNELLRLRSELEQTNSLLEEAERIGRTGSWLWDIPSRKMTWSNGCYQLFGFDRKIFYPSFEAFIGIAHPEDRNRLEDHLRNLLTGSAKQPFVFKYEGHNKEVKYIAIDAVVSFNDLKQAVKVMGSMTDITEKKSFESNESAHKVKINYILNSSLNGAYIYNFNTQSVEYTNPPFTELLGYTLKDVQLVNGDDFFTLFHPEDRDKMREHFASVAKGDIGKTYPTAHKFKCKDTDEYLHVYSNHTIYEVNQDSGLPEKMLVTFFASKK